MLIQFYRDQIDIPVNLLLEALFELPKNEAIAALEVLIKLPMMSEAERDYPLLPELFQQPVYQTIQDQLKQLSEIMYNRQPQGQVKHSDDQSPETNFGKFGIRIKENGTVTAEDVHQYMRYKFALTAYSVAAFQTLPSKIKDRNTNSYHQYLYYKFLAQWVRQSSEKPIPKGMKIIIKGVAAFDTAQLEESLTPFYTYMINCEEIINNLCKLSPAIFDPDMAPCLESLFCKDLTDDIYQVVQKKLQDQIDIAGGKFSQLKEVCLGFITVAKVREALISYGDLIRSHDENLFNEVNTICQEHSSHLLENDVDKQEPLKEAKTALLKEFLEQTDEFANEKTFNAWISNFFANYFASQEKVKNSLVIKILNLALNQDKLFVVNDPWLVKVAQENCAIQGDEVAITFKPYHINRIVLHALTTPVDNWSCAYQAVFKHVLKLLSENDDLFLNQKLKRDSYPPAFLAQLNWLNRLYEIKDNKNEALGEQPPSEFPMLYYPENRFDFARILSCLSLKQMSVFCESLRGKLLDIIRDAGEFSLVFNQLSNEQRSIVYESFRDKLPDIIKNAEDCGQVIQWLSARQIKFVFEKLQDKLPGIIRKARDLAQVIKRLSAEQIKVVFEKLQDKLPDIIREAKDFGQVIQWLSDERINVVFGELQHRLPDIIRNVEDYGQIIQHCVAGKVVFEKLQDKLPGIIRNAEDLGRVSQWLFAEQVKVIFEKLHDKLPDIIRNVEDFGRVIQWCCSGQIKVVFEKLQDKLPGIIKNAEDLGQVLKKIPIKQVKLVFEKLKDKLPGIIRSAEDLSQVLKGLSVEQVKFVFEKLQDKLPDVIRNAEDFGHVLKGLSAEQTKVVFEKLQDKLPDIIKNAWDYRQTCLDLSPEQKEIVYENFKDKLLAIIKNSESCGLVFSCFPSAVERDIAYERLEFRLSKTIKNAKDFYLVIKQLSAKQRNLFFKSLKGILLWILKDTEDFSLVIRCLTAEQIQDFCIILKDKLPAILKDTGDLSQVIRCLSVDQIQAFCESIKDILPGIVKNTEDFYKVLRWLSAKQKYEVYISFKDKLPDIIKNAEDFRQVLSCFFVVQIKVVFENLKDKLPSISKNAEELAEMLSFLNNPQQIYKVVNRLNTTFPEKNEVKKDYDSYHSEFLNRKFKFDFFGSDFAKKEQAFREGISNEAGTSSNGYDYSYTGWGERI